MAKKAKQKEFAEMPERNELGRKAIEYMNQCDRIEGLKSASENTRKELVVLFKKVGKAKITVEGRTVSYAHVENDKISIRQNLNKGKEE